MLPTNRRRPSLRAYALGLTALAMIPTFGVGAGTVFLVLRDLRQTFEMRLGDTADAVAVALNRHLEVRRAVLDTLAQSSGLDRPEVPDPRFVRHARNTDAALGLPISLRLPDGTVMLRTDEPPGTQPHYVPPDRAFERALTTRLPTLDNLEVAQARILPLIVPVVRNDEVVGLLATRLSQASLTALLKEARPDTVLFANIVDGNGRVVARDPVNQNVGNMAPDWIRAAQLDTATGHERIARGRSLAGVDILAAVRPVPDAPGWAVVVAAPLADYEKMASLPLRSLVLGGAVILLGAFAAAFAMARRLTQPIVALTRHAERVALGVTRPVAPPAGPFVVKELEALRLALLRAEEHQRLLVQEVNHRAKNLLAVVQSVVNITKAESIPQFVRAVTARIFALARAHSLLAQHGWHGAELRLVAARELETFLASGHLILDGPPVALAATAVQPVSMILHELATNAAKHGALSQPSGRVRLTWRIAAQAEELALHWEERFGPLLAAPPTRKGFGIRMVDNSVAQLGGRIERHWLVTGLACAISLPLPRILRELVRAPEPPPDEPVTPDR
ncbi:sensor histidine kinase [Siccirubricoccus soli]|uniref:sensor histidine kinase n=1 Tax=Siccirubricoccus soli TaxID=2899147 RepID=UPI0020946A57|nr:sensor histidine kinase [Siccirubricoccus soli]